MLNRGAACGRTGGVPAHSPPRSSVRSPWRGGRSGVPGLSPRPAVLCPQEQRGHGPAPPGRKLTHCALSDVAGRSAEAKSKKIRDLRAKGGAARLNKSRVKRPNGRRSFSLDRRPAARTRRSGPARTRGLRGGRQREPGRQRPSVPCGSQSRPCLVLRHSRPRGEQPRPCSPADPFAQVGRGESGRGRALTCPGVSRRVSRLPPRSSGCPPAAPESGRSRTLDSPRPRCPAPARAGSLAAPRCRS